MLEASKAVLKNVAPDLPEMQVRISYARLQARLFSTSLCFGYNEGGIGVPFC